MNIAFDIMIIIVLLDLMSDSRVANVPVEVVQKRISQPEGFALGVGLVEQAGGGVGGSITGLGASPSNFRALTKTGRIAPVVKANGRCPIALKSALIAPEWLVMLTHVSWARKTSSTTVPSLMVSAESLSLSDLVQSSSFSWNLLSKEQLGKAALISDLVERRSHVWTPIASRRFSLTVVLKRGREGWDQVRYAVCRQRVRGET